MTSCLRVHPLPLPDGLCARPCARPCPGGLCSPPPELPASVHCVRIQSQGWCVQLLEPPRVKTPCSARLLGPCDCGCGVEATVWHLLFWEPRLTREKSTSGRGALDSRTLSEASGEQSAFQLSLGLCAWKLQWVCIGFVSVLLQSAFISLDFIPKSLRK